MSKRIPRETKDPRERQLILRVMAMPADANAYGDIFGGWLMAQMDIAGGILAIQTAQGRVATVAVNAMQFIQPVAIGDVVSIYGRLHKLGTTSIRVELETYAERDRDFNQLHEVATATLTYVALDDQGRPRPVVPATEPT